MCCENILLRKPNTDAHGGRTRVWDQDIHSWSVPRGPPDRSRSRPRSVEPFDCGETMTIPGPNVSHPPRIAGCDRRLLSDTHVGRFLDPPAYVHVDGVFRARESLGELRVQQRGRVWQGEARQLNVRSARTPDVHKSTVVFDHRAQSRR